MDKLSLIKLFVSVVDLGNFTAVANQLGQSLLLLVKRLLA
ncbi:transcriptional regulator, LysR family [Vibrio sp. JCM 18905]|nr:transcriptional regulator, LysR family [Vibrio sp. JCM 18905]